MRKLGWPVALALVVALTATCGGDDDASNGATAAPTATTVEATEQPSLSGAELGQQVANRFGCAACHSVSGEPRVGPTWLGLFGTEVELADGSTVTVDEAYLRESIVEPNAKIAEGFAANIMPPDFGMKLTDEQIEGLIAYIKTLR